MKPIYIDIETQRTTDPAVIARLTANVKPPGNYKKPESVAQWWASEGLTAKREAIDKTALDGTYGRLATIGVFDERWTNPVILGDEGSTEESILVAFSILMKDQPDYYFVAFNGEFDFRFLKQRAIINGVKIPNMPLGRGDYYFDPMKEWAGYRNFIKQQDLEYALGITREDKITGADVGTAIDAGDWGSVIKHNAEDLRCLREIHLRMTR